MTGPLDPEYGRQLNARFVSDVSAGATGEASWFDPGDKQAPRRLDYIFASAGIAPRISGGRVDQSASGSDHRPVWVTLS